MQVRQATVADARRIAQIHVETWRAAYRGQMPDAVLDALDMDRRETVWNSQLATQPHGIAVAESEKEIIGFCCFIPSRDKDSKPEEIGEIAAIYVQPEFWRSGAGTVLCRHALNEARLRKFWTIMNYTKFAIGFLFSFFVAFGSTSHAADTFRVATYNVENYLDQPTESRLHVKSAEARAKIRESIEAIKPDVLALEEMGTTNALLELRASLKADGLDFPFWEHVSGADTNIHIAVLSRLPIVASRPHTNDLFLLDGRQFRVERGFAEVDIQAATNFTFTLIAAHLKSKLSSPVADEAEERFEEAKILRGIVDEHFTNNPNARLVVLGDFNDVKDSDAIREIVGRGKFRLTDTRPAERNGDSAPSENSNFDPRNVTWTEFYGKEDIYTRMDFILLSPALARDWLKAETFIPVIPNWGVGSDHRPIVAAFKLENN